MQSSSKSRAFIRVAAALLLVAVITTLVYSLTFNVAKELSYHTIIPIIKNLFIGKSSANMILQLLSNVIPLIRVMIGIVLLFIAVIMLFALKEKAAGRLFIIYGIVNTVLNIAGLIVYLILIRNSPDIKSVISANLWPNIEYLLIQTLFILLGLLLCGAFKGASKVFGFILLGLFSVCVIYNTVYFIRGIPHGVNYIIGGAGKSTAFYVISSITNYFIEPPALILTYTGCIFCCLGVALKPRESVKTEPEIS
jgi:hypothetical protein